MPPCTGATAKVKLECSEAGRHGGQEQGCRGEMVGEAPNPGDRQQVDGVDIMTQYIDVKALGSCHVLKSGAGRPEHQAVAVAGGLMESFQAAKSRPPNGTRGEGACLAA